MSRAQELIEGSKAQVYEYRVYRYGVSYSARHSPSEKRLYESLLAIMPRPTL